MRIKKVVAIAALAVGLTGLGSAAQALVVDAGQELGFLGAVLQGVDNAVDRETDELVTDANSPVRHLATDEGSLVDEVAEGLISGGDAVLLEDVEDVLCIVLEGDVSPDCEDGADDEDGLLGDLLPDLLDADGGILAILEVGAFVGLF